MIRTSGEDGIQQTLKELQRMQFDRHPDAIRVGVITVPGITEAAVTSNHEKRIVCESRRHQDVLVKCFSLVIEEFMHVSRTQDLCMYLENLMSRVNSVARILQRKLHNQL